MNKSNYDLITNMSMVGCPLFEGYPWELYIDHVNGFIQFFQSIGVQDDYTSSDIFPLTLHGQEGYWYRSISPNPNLVVEAIFTKFIFDFPSPPNPPQCDFCSGPHAQSTCRFFIESK